MGTSFAERFATARSRYGPLVWGLDPSGEILDSWGLTDSPDGLDRFADIVLTAAVGSVGVVKPQSAFYERHGWRGFQTLQRLVSEARGAGLLVIVDAKRGDVGTTNQAYAEAFLGDDAPLAADALTVHPYLGFGAMDAFVTRAHAARACLLVVVRSSNPEGRALQGARTDSDASVEAELLRQVATTNARLVPNGLGPVGAVVGARAVSPALDLAGMNGVFLAPGVGAQGATAADVGRAFAACPDRVMPSASRSLLEPGPEVSKLRDGLAHLGGELAAALGP